MNLYDSVYDKFKELYDAEDIDDLLNIDNVRYYITYKSETITIYIPPLDGIDINYRDSFNRKFSIHDQPDKILKQLLLWLI